MNNKVRRATKEECDKIWADCEKEVEYIQTLRGRERDDYIFNMIKESEAHGELDD